MSRGDGQPIIISGAFGNTGPHCAGIVETINSLQEGGEIVTKYVGCGYVFKGFLDNTILQSIYSGKRLIAGLPKLLSNKWITMPAALFGCFTFILPKSVRKSIIFSIGKYLSEGAYLSMHQYVLAEGAYSRPIRELYAPTTNLIRRHCTDPEVISIFEIVRDVLLMMLQFDIAYRFRYQDVFPLIDKQLLKENPRKEIMRVIKIYTDRETSFWIWKEKAFLFDNLNLFLWIVFKKKSRRESIIAFFMEINLEKIARDEADWYYVLDRTDYAFGALTHYERMKISAEMDKKMGNKRPEIRVEQSNQEKVEFIMPK